MIALKMTAMKRLHILPLILPAISLTVAAQDLNKEITIDRDIIPAQRAAARPVVFPGVIPPKVDQVTLPIGETGLSTQLTPALGHYEPAGDGGAYPLTPYRGYVDLGYFPAADLGLSAGYALIDKSNTALNIWLQGDNRSYKGGDEDFGYKTLDLTAGVGFKQKTGRFNTLSFSTDVSYSTWSIPGTDKNPANLRWNIAGDFDGRSGDRFTYGIGACFGILDNSGDDTKAVNYLDGLKLVNQNKIGFNARLRYSLSGPTAVGLRVEGSFLDYNTFLTPAMLTAALPSAIAEKPAGETLGQIDFLPSVSYNGGSFYGRAGVRAGLSVNSGNSFHIAPDILLGVNPDARFGAWLRLGGGVNPNDLADLLLTSRYADRRVAYGFSNIPVNGQVGVRIGPFSGAALILTLDYAAANDWLMPLQVTEGAPVYNLFTPSKIRAWKMGASFDWQWRKLLTLALAYEYNPGNGDSDAWLYWRDRARHIAGTTLTVTPGELCQPLTPLSVNVSFTARIDRRQATMSDGAYEFINDQDYIQHRPYQGYYDLDDMTSLSAGASWRFTGALTVFARFDNILDNRAKQIFGIPAQGFTGLVGLGYKF